MGRVLSEETSLSRKRRALLKESDVLTWVVRIEAALAGLLLLGGAALYIGRGSESVFWLGVAATVFFVAHLLKIRQNREEERKVQAGIMGENEMSRRLAEALDNSHYILNDFIVRMGRKSAQIDHLVVSPRGMFAIETKNWRGHIEGDEEADHWTQIKSPGEPPVRVSNPIRQSRRHLEVLSAALQRAGLNWPDLHAMVVFTSPHTTFNVRHVTTPVLKPGEVVDFIAGTSPQRTYNEDEISAVLTLFME